MENNILSLGRNKKQSLEAWVNEIFMPVTSAIGYISSELEMLYRELW